MDARQLASLDAEIGMGVSKEKSRFKSEEGFSETWDRYVAGREKILAAHPNASFEIPNEFPEAGPETKKPSKVENLKNKRS